MLGIRIPGFPSEEKTSPVESAKPEKTQKFIIPPVVWILVFVVIGILGVNSLLEG